MSRIVTARRLTGPAFAAFGDMLAADGAADTLINRGLCARFHDRARLDFGAAGRAGISLFRAAPRSLPLQLDMMERHPEGSQAFIPMSEHPFLVIVAPDEGGRPATPQAFVAPPGAGVNYLRGVWHGVLAPLHAPGLFAVIDRIGAGANLEEHWFDAPWQVEA